MDFMKVFDQTVREIKREVNLKVLKVPEMEQKVLDATDNEPWGPHGSDMAEIAKATKKFSECQMVMNVLWTRLGETGKDWRYVYKALAVIEYLVSHGSERAVDDIIEHTFQISSLTSFEYVEPSGKDSGINVRKKAETIVALLNNKDKIQEVRNKAAANQNKYVGLSSTGITYKSGSATSLSYSGGSYQSSDRYGGMGGTGSGDRFRDNYKDRDQHDEDKYEKKSSRSRRESRESSSKKNYGSRKDQDNMSSDKYSSKPSQAASVPSDDYEDDFDPRGISTTKAPGGNSNQVDLFGHSLIGDLMDAPTSVPEDKFGTTNGSSEVDLFADANFVSAPPQADAGAFADATFVSAPSQAETGGFADAFVSAPPHSVTGSGVDLFASQPTISQSASSPVDLFSGPVPVMQPQTKSTSPAPTNTNLVDPFAAVPLNSFDGSDFLEGFTSHSGSTSSEPTHSIANDASHSTLDRKSSADSETPPKKDSFQVKSGIWADSLSRGLIDLNITGPKKVNLAGVGIVGGLNDGSDEREKGPPTSFYMGTAMGSGTGLGKSGYQGAGDDDFFSSLSGGQQYPYGGFQK